MRITMGMLKIYLTNEKAATAIEYGLIMAGIALAISAAVFLFGEGLSNLFGNDLSATLKHP